MSITSNANLEVYNQKDLVDLYAQSSRLYPAEYIILNELAGEWKQMRFLDVGIGAGRTTIHFASLVKEYVGVDYAEEMIRVCKERFGEVQDRRRFAVCDARDMRDFEDGSFDFLFFSYNGIDYVPHTDRLAILAEVARVLKPGGRFLFSTHNIRYFPQLFRIPLCLSFSKFRRKLTKRRILRSRYPNYREIAQARHAFVYDGQHEFRLQCYYVDPEEQLAQLKAAGFSDIRLFSENGRECTLTSQCLKTDPWVNYLARR
jgi:ubiquinone/menaquinone biosynthesis C-methylase UbiE